MIVAVLSIKLVMRQARSLKDKRRIIKSLKDRVRNKFNVSVAEIGMQDNRQCSVIGVSMIGNDRRYLNGALSNVINILEFYPQVELADYQIEFL